MLELGIASNVRRAARYNKYIASAQYYFEKTKEIETQFSLAPDMQRINEMMDLMRSVLTLLSY
jgi:hypothetical protein